MLRATPESQPGKFLCANRADDRFRAIVASRAAVRMNANRAQRQLHFIPHGQQRVHMQLALREQFPHRDAAQVHIRLRLGQEYFFSCDLATTYERLPFRPLDANPVAIRQLVNDHESQVMRRPLVLRIGIPKSDDEPHIVLALRSRRAEPQSNQTLQPNHTLRSFATLRMTIAGAPTTTSFLSSRASLLSRPWLRLPPRLL